MTNQGQEWTGSYTTTRSALHLVAVHILARRRAALTGRFGLRPSPGGFGTPMFGAEEVLRVDGETLVRERREGTDPTANRTVSATIDLPGATLRSLAAFADVDLTTPFSVGRDTPELGDLDAPLAIDSRDVAVMASWFELGAEALDRAIARLGPAADPAVAQIWPEHFDLGLDVAVGGTRANLGASPGDHLSAAPYLYVGPVTADRSGDAEFWNVPFGALRTFDEILSIDDADAFIARGLDQLAGA